MDGYMINVKRPDVFKVEKLKGLSGPVQILKSIDPNLENSPVTKIIVTTEKLLQDEYLCIEDDLLDKWTSHGDIGYVDSKGIVRIVLSRLANANTLLVTEQCDNLCLFCSQPPKKIDDTILYAFAALSIVSFNTNKVIGISGGEPLLNYDAISNFFEILNKFNNTTPLHILTNGRTFKSLDITKLITKNIKGRYVEFGIPLYSTNSRIHDELVNAKGAWDDTIRGLINAGNHGLPIELRIIPTSKNKHEISAIIELALTAFNQIRSISIMNLEHTGWAKRNWKSLYIPPQDYALELINACALQDRYKVNINLFNYPLCHIPDSIHKHAQKSISDWKNVYTNDCKHCSIRTDCCGFFVSEKNKVTIPVGRII